jgi:hypothetical protein
MPLVLLLAAACPAAGAAARAGRCAAAALQACARRTAQAATATVTGCCSHSYSECTPAWLGVAMHPAGRQSAGQAGSWWWTAEGQLRAHAWRPWHWQAGSHNTPPATRQHPPHRALLVAAAASRCASGSIDGGCTTSSTGHEAAPHEQRQGSTVSAGASQPTRAGCSMPRQSGWRRQGIQMHPDSSNAGTSTFSSIHVMEKVEVLQTHVPDGSSLHIEAGARAPG